MAYVPLRNAGNILSSIAEVCKGLRTTRVSSDDGSICRNTQPIYVTLWNTIMSDKQRAMEQPEAIKEGGAAAEIHRLL
jgi:hypothetical protein